MKILSVEITNITSIEGPYLINFESEIFSNIGLFGITGPVGAGKSSLIDAICLGLFNTTPRLERNSSNTSIQYEAESVNTNSPQNLLRRGAGSGSVVVRFKAIDNQIWQSTWLLRRARDLAHGKLQPVSMTLINESLNETFPDSKITKVLEKIKSLIGLDFKQFTKSVILAQGDFQAFLNATDSERAQILEKLTGTEIYSEISKGIYEKNNQIKEQFSQIDHQINALQLLSNEELVALENRIAEIENEIKNLSLKKEQLVVAEKWYQTKSELEQQVTTTNQKLVAAQNNWSRIQPEIQLLQKVTQFQEIKPVVVENTESKNQVLALETEIKNLEHVQTQLKKQLAAQEIQFAEKNATKMLLLQQARDHEPLYKKARKLDVQLTNTSELLTQQKKKSEARITEIEQVNKQVHAQTEIKKLKNEAVNQINAWFAANTQVKNWVENASLLQHHFQLFSKVSTQINTLLHEHKNVLVASDFTTKKLIDLNQKTTTLQQQLQEISAEIDTQKATINRHNLEQTVAKQNGIATELGILKELKSLAQSYASCQKQQNKNQAEYQQAQTNLLATQTALQNTEQSLAAVTLQLNQQRFYVDKLKLESSSHVLHLRSQLKPGCECPVCGSSQHQIEKVTVINTLLTQAETDLEKLVTQEKEFLGALSKHQANKSHLNETLETLRVKNTELDLDQKIIWDKWREIALADVPLNVQQDNVLLLLENEMAKKVAASNELARIVNQITQLQKEIADKEVIKNSISLNLEQINTLLTQAKVEQETNKNKQEQIEIDGVKLRTQQKENKALLTQIIGIPNWLNEYENDAENFMRQLFSSIALWNEKTTQVEHLKMELNQIENELTMLHSILEEKNKEQQLLITAIAQENNVLKELQALRNNIFNGENIDLVEQREKLEFSSCEQQVEELTKAIQNLKSELIKAQTSAHEKNALTTSLKAKIAANTAKIDAFKLLFQQRYNCPLQQDELEKLSSYSHEWISQTRENLEKLKEEIAGLEGAKSAVMLQLEKHIQNQAPEKSRAEIIEQHQQIETYLKQNHSLLITEKGKQINHNNNIDSQLKLVQKREELLPDYTEWAELTALLGSANGDRLKKLAQQFTLDLLLQAANAQLQQINNRYTLERIEDTLSILVIDQYMANSKRATNSLSGGETFLVSLALSLALSTISSTQLKVESLFIDEGFGSLDPNSLETAFLALENLQNQGRMVGIISHLDAVIDRLAVKIEVIPQGNGKSKIQIVA